MKKFMLCIMGLLIALFVVFWCCISYTVNYKKITCDTSVSPDKKYEVILQAVGEPEWPFGSASGRLVLKEGEDKISQTDFELDNDGGSITSNCWKVTWYEDYVEVILSGEEQFDEQVILYFDGTKEIQQLAYLGFLIIYTYIDIGVFILGFFMGKIIVKRSIDISFLLCLIYALISFGLMLLIGSLKYVFYDYMYSNFTFTFSIFIESLGDRDSLFVSIGTFISFFIGEIIEYINDKSNS